MRGCVSAAEITGSPVSVVAVRNPHEGPEPAPNEIEPRPVVTGPGLSETTLTRRPAVRLTTPPDPSLRFLVQTEIRGHEGRWQARAYLSLSSAERAVERALARGCAVRLVLCRLLVVESGAVLRPEPEPLPGVAA